jgi:diadenylate cyclase
VPPVQEYLTNYWKSLIELVVVIAFLSVGYRYLSERSSGRTLAGVLILVAIYLLAHFFERRLIENVAFFLAFALVVIFQQELRRSFVDLGSRGLFASTKGTAELVDQLQLAVRQLSSKRYGALFALERSMELNSYLETGVPIDSQFTPELVMTVFHPKTALHDGGMILRKTRIEGAGCVFPISQREMADRSIGLRHRAAIGMTEESDAIAVVVSEETGHISIAVGGELERDLTLEEFKDRLETLLLGDRDEDDEDDESDGTGDKPGDDS